MKKLVILFILLSATSSFANKAERCAKAAHIVAGITECRLLGESPQAQIKRAIDTITDKNAREACIKLIGSIYSVDLPSNIMLPIPEAQATSIALSVETTTFNQCMGE